MKLSDYNYHLPKERIAHFPPEARGDARLLVLDRSTGNIRHERYENIVDHLEAGDVLVLNDTKVIRARLIAADDNGKKVEIFLLEKHADGKPTATRSGAYPARVIYRGKLHEGDILTIDDATLRICKVHNDGTAEIESSVDLYALSDEKGAVPLPPYMQREATDADTERYQTVFAKHRGSVAAPTASLNMTGELLDKIKAKGVVVTYLTLHVGLGTFAPIKSDDLEDHHMHSEHFIIPLATIAAIRSAKRTGKSVVALGTTVTRALEYAHIDVLDTQEICESRGEANIFIYPGYHFKVIDALITNFHAPKSTVLMLTAAFAGWDNLKNAYDTAVENEYNFLSYGDSMMIL